MEKIIDGFPNYSVDENGVVRNVKSGKVIAQQIYAGYKCVSLWCNKRQKWHKVHRLVATAFVPNPQNLPCINHKDENKLNNHVSNLEWCDYSYNNQYGANAPLKKAAEARRKKAAMYDRNGNLLAIFRSTTEAQKITGVNQSNISGCCLQRKHFLTAGGYIWKFT
jgi:hypothetical protein